MDATKNNSQKEFMGRLSGLMKSLERLEKLAWKWTGSSGIWETRTPTIPMAVCS